MVPRQEKIITGPRKPMQGVKPLLVVIYNQVFLPDILKVSVMALLIVAITLGNTVSLLVFLRARQFKTCQGYLKTSLALADLAVGMVVVPYSVYREVNRLAYGVEEQDEPGPSGSLYTSLPCFILGPLYAWCTFVSITTIFLLSVERSVAVFKPLHKKAVITKKRTAYLIAFSWILSLSLAVVPMIFNEQITLEYSCCSKMCNYVLNAPSLNETDWNVMLLFPTFDFSLLSGTFAINFVTFAAIRQYCKVRKQMSLDAQNTARKLSFSDITAARTIGILTFAFSASFIPIAVFVVGNVLGYEWCEFSFYAFWILTLNSCWNVVIYSVRDQKFRQGVRELFTSEVLKSPSQRPTRALKTDSSSPPCVAVLKEIFRPEST
ncbi:trace amine-associated receptor 13c [Microcaecilia unicolor]|uniref:Trace amine-associated receptor 13c-like n=1 Tax=Microcaecilia unicolor TaxID=1415580 RepID=A0A6P7Z0R0_9AMPH|nr:trace amine-associated receptor 13c-like [Microcaecilia unicolor]